MLSYVRRLHHLDLCHHTLSPVRTCHVTTVNILSVTDVRIVAIP